MASIGIGGDPENYMQAPRIQAADGGLAGKFIASLLDKIGVNKQVGTGEPASGGGKESEMVEPEILTGGPAAASPSPGGFPALDAASQVFPAQDTESEWGKRWLNSLRPIGSIDPNDTF